MQYSDFWNGSKSFYPKRYSLFFFQPFTESGSAWLRKKRKKNPSESLSICATSVREPSQRERGGADAFDWKQRTPHLTRASEVTPDHPPLLLSFACWLWELLEVVGASAVAMASAIFSSSSSGFGSSRTCHVPPSSWISASITVVWTRKPRGPPVCSLCVPVQARHKGSCTRWWRRKLHLPAWGPRFVHKRHTKQASGLSYGLSPSRQEHWGWHLMLPLADKQQKRGEWLVGFSVRLWQRLSSFRSLKLASESIGNGPFIIHLP